MNPSTVNLHPKIITQSEVTTTDSIVTAVGGYSGDTLLPIFFEVGLQLNSGYILRIAP